MNNNLMNTILTNKWLLKAAVVALCGGLMLSGPAWAAKVKLLATGQTGCWNPSGGVVDCPGTGQDGEYQKGVKPGKAGRFKDMGDGSVKDLLTGLFWLKNASCDELGPTANWQGALDAANGLASGQCDLTDKSEAGDWRLPNSKEFASLIDHGQYNPALPAGHPFSGVQSGTGKYYWSSTSSVGTTQYAWVAFFFYGFVTYDAKTNGHYVWPVRGGK